MTKKTHVFENILTAGLLVYALTVGYEGFHARKLDAASSLQAGEGTVVVPACWHCVDANHACNLMALADSVSKNAICYRTGFTSTPDPLTGLQQPQPGFHPIPAPLANCAGTQGQKRDNSKTPSGISALAVITPNLPCAPTKRYACKVFMIKSGNTEVPEKTKPDGTSGGTHVTYRWQEESESPPNNVCGKRDYCSETNRTYEESCKTPPKQ